MKTLYESIPDKAAFEATVFNAVHKALIDLGEDIKQLDWANVAVAEHNRGHNP